jgi:hypothetical protein
MFLFGLGGPSNISLSKIQLPTSSRSGSNMQNFTFIGSDFSFVAILVSDSYLALSETHQWRFVFKYDNLYTLTHIIWTMHFPSPISEPPSQNLWVLDFFLCFGWSLCKFTVFHLSTLSVSGIAFPVKHTCVRHFIFCNSGFRIVFTALRTNNDLYLNMTNLYVHPYKLNIAISIPHFRQPGKYF